MLTPRPRRMPATIEVPPRSTPRTITVFFGSFFRGGLSTNEHRLTGVASNGLFFSGFLSWSGRKFTNTSLFLVSSREERVIYGRAVEMKSSSVGARVRRRRGVAANLGGARHKHFIYFFPSSMSRELLCCKDCDD